MDSANVTITNMATAEVHRMVTKGSGNYTFVNILPGRYSLEGEKTGFKKVIREPIIMEIESGLRVDLTLEVGAVTQTIEVSPRRLCCSPKPPRWGKSWNSEPSQNCL